MVGIEPQIGASRRAAVFFGTVLCVLLAFFAVERRVAAYPSNHSAAAITTVATGVQKPQHVSVADQQSVEAPAILLCVVALFACVNQPVWRRSAPVVPIAFASWAPAALAVRPPPAL